MVERTRRRGSRQASPYEIEDDDDDDDVVMLDVRPCREEPLPVAGQPSTASEQQTFLRSAYGLPQERCLGYVSRRFQPVEECDLGVGFEEAYEDDDLYEED